MGWRLPKGIWKNLNLTFEEQALEFIVVGYTENVPTGIVTSKCLDNAGCDFLNDRSAFGAPNSYLPCIKKGEYIYGYDINFAEARRIIKEGKWVKLNEF